MFVETLWLRSHNNRKATRLLFADVAQRGPSTFFLLGDVVNLGYSNRQWKPIDGYLQTLREAGIELHAILGNHEVMGRPLEGMRKFQQRFPEHKPTGYTVVKDSIAVVLVNSNFKNLSLQDEQKQRDWYNQTLQELDAATEVRYVIVGCHHSPYTNSRIVRPSKEAEETFVPPFLSSKKGCLFLSGHSHNFEHYKVQGKDFLVIGGGGGLRQPLRQGIGTLADLLPDYKPMFHYVTVQESAGGLQVTSYHISSSFNGFEEGRRFVIKPKE